MQTEGFDEFDRELRSMLEDVREEAPSHVWKAVEPQLVRRQSPVFRWGFAAFAVAAMSALVIFLTTPGRPDEAAPVQQASLFAEAPQDAQPVTAVAAPSASVPVAPVSVNPDVAAPASPAAGFSKYAAEPVVTEQSVPSDVVAPVDEAPAATGLAAAQPAVSETAASGSETAASAESKVYSGPSGSARIVDEFTKMDIKDARESSVHRVDVDVRGSFSSNDKTSSGTFANARYATSGNVSSPVISESSESRYSVPVSFGIGARFYLSDRLALGSGLQYTYLSRSFQGTYSGDSDLQIDHGMHYVGIPLNLSVDIVRSKMLDFYAFAGGAVEYAVSNKYKIHTSTGIVNRDEPVNGVQWSAGAGLGLQFNVTDFLGIYIDPSVKYFFDCSQPKNVRTQKPFMFNFELGLRFKL